MSYLDTMRFDSTLKDFEFTRKAQRQIRRVVTSKSFEDMDADAIFNFLFKEMQMVSFKDYLKRYLYERAGIQAPYREVPEEAFRDLIRGSFEENNVPASLEPGSTRLPNAIKSWLASDRVRRETVFLLGFGLRMAAQDVSDFLTKVLKEDDFRLDDPLEAIYSFCYRQGLPFARASELKREYEALRARGGGAELPENGAIKDEKSLLNHLARLKGAREGGQEAETLRQFMALYGRCREAIAAIYNQDEEEKPAPQRKTWQAEEVGPADLEQMLYSGVPLSSGGNLARANQSLLHRQFASYRLSRQRLSGVLGGQLKPDRFDLMTLVFFLHAQKDLPGEERLSKCLDETNQVLGRCGLGQLHPANPYEAFLLICILSEVPLAVFSDIWELSYSENPA